MQAGVPCPFLQQAQHSDHVGVSASDTLVTLLQANPVAQRAGSLWKRSMTSSDTAPLHVVILAAGVIGEGETL